MGNRPTMVVIDNGLGGCIYDTIKEEIATAVRASKRANRVYLGAAGDIKTLTPERAFWTGTAIMGGDYSSVPGIEPEHALWIGTRLVELSRYLGAGKA